MAAQHKADIEAAQARCTVLLKSIAAVAIPKDPIEEGECGTLAPVELVSVGKNPEVALSPPAIVNCDMAVAIHNWMKSDVQPLALKHLGKPVVRLETMSSYSCRHAYGRVHGKLSEHGKANALDVRGFATASGETAYVLEDWGPTSVEIAAAAAAAQKAQAEQALAAAKAKALAEAEAQARQLAAAKKGQPGTPPGNGAIANPLANATTLIEGLPKPPGTGLGLAPPSKLGGPKKKTAVQPPANLSPPAAANVSSDGTATAAKSQFLHAVHDQACHRFGTTLGPEANAEHRNHIHIDLAERKFKSICE